MASEYSAEDVLYIERFAYDTLAYTLPLCGFPKRKIPPTNRKTNTYHLDNFIIKVGISVLPTALMFRETWMLMFETRQKNSGFNYEDLANYFRLTRNVCFELKNENPHQKVLTFLSMYNEIILFFDLKGIEIDFDRLLHSWGSLCMEYTERSGDIKKTMENLIAPQYVEKAMCNRWVVDFLKKQNRPYGRQIGISDRFKDHFTKVWKKAGIKNVIVQKSLVEDPDELQAFEKAAAALGANLKVTEDTRLPSKSFNSHSESPRQPTFSTSQNIDVERKRPSGRRSVEATGGSEILEGNQRSNTSSELDVENRFGRMSLGNEMFSQKSHASTKRKPSTKKSTKATRPPVHELEGSQKSTPLDEDIVARLGSLPPGYVAAGVSTGCHDMEPSLPGNRELSDSTENPASSKHDEDDSKIPSRTQSAKGKGSSQCQGAIPKRKPSNRKRP